MIVNKPEFCSQCPISQYTTGYTPLKVRGDGSVLFVGEASGEDEVRSGEGFSGGSGRWLWNMAGKAGIPRERASTLNVIGCHPSDNVFPTDPKWRWTSKDVARDAVAYCTTHHMWPGVKECKPKKIFAVGSQSLVQLTGKVGINTWRGSPLPIRGQNKPTVMPIIHPAFLMRQAKLVSVTVGDLRKPLAIPPENYNLTPTPSDLARFKSREFSIDFEWDGGHNITLCGLSDRFYSAIVVPFTEPYIGILRGIVESASCIIAHNAIGAELREIERLGWKLRDDCEIHDTMLMQHLCQPDYKHGLDFVASVFTNKVFWKGHGWSEIDEHTEGDEAPGQQWRTWSRSDALPRELGGYGGCTSDREAFALYNARDTDAGFQIDSPLQSMLDKWELNNLYHNVSLPAGYICRWIGDRGLRIDTSRLGDIRVGIDRQIGELEERLPDGLRPYEKTVACNLPAPIGTYKPKIKTCKGTKRNALDHPVYTCVFNQPDTIGNCPHCGKVLIPGKMELAKIVKGTKQVRIAPYNSPPSVEVYTKSLKLRQIINRKTGNSTTGKQARGIWAKDHPEFVTLGALKQQVTLRNNFAKQSLLGLDRMFFNLKVHGTSEGRLSSTGQRKGIDVNIQNQPESFRVIYIPDKPDWGFVNIDISQGESWLTCWLAEDWARWEKLQSDGYDEHSELASAIFNRSINKAACKADPSLNAFRQIGKKTNHASSYGMGWKKFFEVLSSEGYDQFTAADCKEFLATWARLNPGTVAWQKRTVETMQRQGYLRNPFGRVRWFSSRDAGTQCLAFLPASTLADCMLRQMIAHYPGEFYPQIVANNTSVFHPLVDEWIMSIQVHDSLVLQGPWLTRSEQIERSTQIMTAPFPELNGFAFRVDVKSSQKSWGDA